MTSRRAFLAGGATGLVALTSGCLGFVMGDPLEFDAGAVRPTDAALEDSGYEEQDADWERIEETVEFGVEREIRASIWTAVYNKEVSIQGVGREAAVFAAVSLPAMEVLGRTLNPLDDMDNEEVLEELRGEIEGEYGTLRDISHDETIDVPILGDQRTVEVYTAKTDLEGQEIEIMLVLTVFDHEDDLLVLLGSHPRLLPDEGVTIEELMESVEHPLEG